MPKIKVQDDELDIAALEEAEYTETEFDTYSGDIPPKGTILNAYVKSMWWTHTKAGDGMLKVLVIADGNEGDLEQYNGLPMWENMALTPSAKFKWKPFIDQFGIAVRDIKNKMIAASTEDHPIFGAEVSKIGTFAPGSEESWCRVVTSRDRYDDTWQAHVFKWLDFEEEPEEEEPEEVEEEEGIEEEEEPEEDEEEEPAPTRTARGRTRTPAAKPAARPARTAARPAATGRRTPAASPRTARPAPVRGRGRPAATEDNEPPF